MGMEFYKVIQKVRVLTEEAKLQKSKGAQA